MDKTDKIFDGTVYANLVSNNVHMTYYNPRGNEENGQFVSLSIPIETVVPLAVEGALTPKGWYEALVNTHQCKTELIDNGTKSFVYWIADLLRVEPISGLPVWTRTTTPSEWLKGVLSVYSNSIRK